MSAQLLRELREFVHAVDLPRERVELRAAAARENLEHQAVP